jgi:hypothetical protein
MNVTNGADVEVVRELLRERDEWLLAAIVAAVRAVVSAPDAPDAAAEARLRPVLHAAWAVLRANSWGAGELLHAATGAPPLAVWGPPGDPASAKRLGRFLARWKKHPVTIDGLQLVCHGSAGGVLLWSVTPCNPP